VSAQWEASADLVVIGSGVAGLTAALDAAELGLRVVVITKDAAGAGCTALAQGGVAVVMGDVPGDSVDAHVSDTLTAGGGVNDQAAVTSILAEGPAAVARLRARGAVFDLAPDLGASLVRTREGGHRALRVIHAGGDATGAELERALLAASADRRLPLLTGHVAVDALRDETGAVVGLTVLDDDGRAGVLWAPAVLVATGGYGQVFASTTNAATATGDGVAFAVRAGASAADLEFIQFHPTALHVPGAAGRRPLVTEAVRGEGAVLRDGTGRPFMAGVHPLADLAPRDVVAAAITRRLAETGAECVWLDATAIPRFAARFPTVYAACASIGVDPSREPIPVSPAAHYTCGGVVTDEHGRTGVPGLYAAGEVARTGLHGANRLASNSLLEGLVVGGRAARAVAADLAAPRRPRSGSLIPPPAVVIADRDVVRTEMSLHAGIGRDATGLATAARAVTTSARACATGPDSRRVVEDAALTLLARSVLTAARARNETRGCHVRTDYPDRDDPRYGFSMSIRLDHIGCPVLGHVPQARSSAA
jgi:L-aspartate oxidase